MDLGHHVSGASTTRWTVRAILIMLQLAAQLKRGASLAVTLALTIRIMLGDAGAKLADDVANAVMQLPTIDYFRHCRLKLDLFNILFQRLLFIEWKFVRYLLIDASSQHGHEYLCVREDRIRYPRSAAYDSVTHMMMQLEFESRICPVSTLGKGNRGAEKKSINVGTIYLME